MGISAADAAILNHPHNYYNNPPSNAWKSTIADSVGLAFALAIVILRCYTKLCITKTRGWEDCKTVPTKERHIRTKFPMRRYHYFGISVLCRLRFYELYGDRSVRCWTSYLGFTAGDVQWLSNGRRSVHDRSLWTEELTSIDGCC